MISESRSERATQDRVIALFRDTLGYQYLGNWESRPGNRHIETALLRANLTRRGYSAAHISAALLELEKAAEVAGSTLYQANLRTYSLLRYGAKVQVAAGAPHDTVHFVEWDEPALNDFAIAEEVTLTGGHERRPDVVLYVNGIAMAVLELKRSSVEVADGIRQLITNQESIFNERFFTTAQLLFAGNDTQGLHYGTVGTPEQFFVQWKRGEPATTGVAATPGELLDSPLAQLCDKARLLDLIRHFVIFDAGRKKVPRQHQYLGVKAAQARMAQREGGVIWHTQGSGKSILMVLLAKWLLEHDPSARVLVVTDRDELDKQITGVMKNAGVVSEDQKDVRVTTRAQLVSQLAATAPRVMCALLHKFNPNDLEGPPPPRHGTFYVFVDECHRTQGGALNKQMKRWLEGAVFIGFTGTPLLRTDKPLTRDVFGTYIHTYKFHEAVSDKVVLDFRYEARHVPQRLTQGEKVDEWFETKTAALNNYQKSVLKKRWANMQELLSSQERKDRVIASIIEDFALKPRLNADRGTAILVAASIRDACHYVRLFQHTTFGKYVGIVTSYEPNHNAISREPADSDERYKFDTYTKHVLSAGQTTGQYEAEIKRRFIEEPANTKLLIVVSKLLTGFDAPSCTYIYFDHELRDHNLFQAICRTNRLDGDDKPFGQIVDFKQLFGEVQGAISLYSSDVLDVDEATGEDGNVPVRDWREEGRRQLENTREVVMRLCEPVLAPQDVEQYLHYFCGEASDPEALNATEPLRIAYYKATAAFARAYAEVATDMAALGYDTAKAAGIKHEVHVYADIRDAIKKYSGEELDIKPYEADMRNLLDMYVLADPAVVIGAAGTQSLVEMIVDTGINDVIARQINRAGRLSKRAIAETIINNVRKVIIRDQLTDPRFYERMSTLLDDLIEQSRKGAEAYEEFLRKAEELARQLAVRGSPNGVPAVLHGNHEATVLFNNLPTVPATTFLYPTPEEALAAFALKLDRTVREQAPAGWRGDYVRESKVKNALYPLLDRDREATTAVFEIVKNQPGY
ncbi:MAG: type I restriction endonuclease subunit R [Gemmatimonas sp.]|nr:type I restriction endonuclease subunit R [Gemmatimonas sp.]